ncbi:hypothetical protein C2E23DRAFT_711728, partial [Lenzites betulinus]
PFDNPSADFVLRSDDKVDFHVWRAILREASPIFLDMFSLSQPHAGGQPPTYMDVPIVHMTESTGTLESLLRYCYPVPDPEFASIDDLKPVLEAARKYQMDYAMRMLAQRLLVLAEAAPLQAYAVALQFDLDNIAQAAAKLTL